MHSSLLILASASPRRAQLLRQLPWDFQIVPSAATEVVSAHFSASELAQFNAYRKARAVSKKHPDRTVIGVDTVVSVGARIFGKPATKAQAREMLAFLQGQSHRVVSGVCLIHLRRHKQKIFCEQTEVTFRQLTLEQIRRYHSQVDPMDKAGAYGIQEKGDVLVEAISGSYTNVVGLPLERLEKELGAFLEKPAAVGRLAAARYEARL